MIIEINFNSDEAIYMQLTNQIIMGIATSRLKDGDALPSVRQLAMELSINPNTIQRAYMQLEQEGLVYPVKGKGNFIADSTSIKRISKKAYTQEMRELIYKGQTLGYDEEELTELVRVCYKEGIK